MKYTLKPLNGKKLEDNLCYYKYKRLDQTNSKYTVAENCHFCDIITNSIIVYFTRYQVSVVSMESVLQVVDVR